MHLLTAAELLGAGVLAGLVSVVASLASVVSYPVLLALGLPPLSANVTNTVALLFTGAGAVAGSQRELAGQGPRVRRLGALTVAGGGVGAAILLLTPADSFEKVAPVLIGGGAAVLLLQPRIRRRLQARQDGAGRDGAGRDGAPGGDGRAGDRGLALRAVVFAVAVYVGYFGAAGGILMLAALATMGDEPLARTNAVKNAISGLANGAAAVGFALFGPVRWAFVVPLAAGFLIGGWAGPAIVRRLPGSVLRVLVALAGLAIAVRLGAAAYR
ncbi:MAG: sulfite exporter TauE/SafE family protein [Actinomycetota bacterium]